MAHRRRAKLVSPRACVLSGWTLLLFFFFAPASVLSVEVAVDVVVNDGTLQTLRASVGEDDLAAAAAAFVATNNVSNGAGCTADSQCVARQLVEALEPWDSGVDFPFSSFPAEMVDQYPDAK